MEQNKSCGKKFKREENLIKNGEKGLKNASFWVISSKKIPTGNVIKKYVN